MDVALLVFLVLLNAIFAASELAVSSLRRARLQVLIEKGDPGAKAALKLSEEPTNFLSTVQIGITSIGVLNGIVGESAFSGPAAAMLERIFHLQPGLASILGTTLVVAVITYFSIVFGELVPKRIGQMYPEAVASFMARPMRWLAQLARPFVALLSSSTRAAMKGLGLRDDVKDHITEEEIDAVLAEGTSTGVIEAQEHQMVRNVFRLDDRLISSLMIPRNDIVWLDAEAPIDEALKVIADTNHSAFPVCRGGLEDVRGVINARDLLNQSTRGEVMNLTAKMRPAVFVPETLTAMELLDNFRTTGRQMVLVVDEYGELQGLVTLRDVLEAIAGEFKPDPGDQAWAIQRDDGSWLMDGLIPVVELKDRLQVKHLPDEGKGRYNTLAGLVMMLLGRVPTETDKVVFQNWSFEVVDMDGRRVDKVLVRPVIAQGVADGGAGALDMSPAEKRDT